MVLLAGACSSTTGASRTGAGPAHDGDPATLYLAARKLVDEGRTAEAWPLACKAAVGGVGQAERLVGEYYWRGYEPVAKDLGKAFVWYSYAERQRPAESLTRVEVAMEMQPDDVAAASRDVAERSPVSDCGGPTAQQPAVSSVAAPTAALDAAGPGGSAVPTPRPRPRG
jgi:TPR repeat protein